jgi:Sugar (and other) transporter
VPQAILYFLPENLLRAGFDIPQALLYTGASSTMLIAGIIPTLFLVDTWGRRPILILGGIGMMLCLSAVGGLQYHVDGLDDKSPNLASAANGIFACELPRPFSLGVLPISLFYHSCLPLPCVLCLFVGSNSLAHPC